MKEISVLVGGKAGDGINNAGAMVARLLNAMGYRIYLYFDYPSLIRGGHNFAIIRGADRAIGTHRNRADFVLALNKETIDRHTSKYSKETVIVFNADQVKIPGNGIPVKEILTGEQAPEIMGNSAMIGGFAKVAGIPWEIVDTVFRAHMPKSTEKNLAVARKAYDTLQDLRKIEKLDHQPQSLVTGNEAIGLGMVRGGLDAYISYPMTPSSSLLHFMADEHKTLGLTVIHPENEIGVMIMALGFAYAGRRVAVGTSGGGFCLMTEGLSFAGQAELPIVLVVSQRTGPSTGLPTYTGQTELDFVLSAGQGEYPRLVVAPGDAQEALYWAAVAVNMAWAFQVPAFILADKTLSEGTYAVDLEGLTGVPQLKIPLWDGKGDYRRYADTETGISSLAFPGTKDAIVKVDSYAHDEAGITTEESGTVELMTRKRLRKGAELRTSMGSYTGVAVTGAPGATTALLCWGSTKGVCDEVGTALGLRVVRPVVLAPFPAEQLKSALAGAKTIIAVEENATAQLAEITSHHGITISDKVLKFDGRPFTPDDLLGRLQEVLQ